MLPTQPNQWNSLTCFYYLLEFGDFSLTKYIWGWARQHHKSLSVNLRVPAVNSRLIQGTTQPSSDNISDGLQLPSGPEWRSSSQRKMDCWKTKTTFVSLATDFLVHGPMKLAASDRMQLCIVWSAGAHERSSWWKKVTSHFSPAQFLECDLPLCGSTC